MHSSSSWSFLLIRSQDVETSHTQLQTQSRKLKKSTRKQQKKEGGEREQQRGKECCTGACATTIVSSGNPGLAICHAISHAYQQHSQNLIENGNVLNLSPLAQLSTRSRHSPRCSAAAQRMHLQPSQISCQCWLPVNSSRKDTLAKSLDSKFRGQLLRCELSYWSYKCQLTDHMWSYFLRNIERENIH